MATILVIAFAGSVSSGTGGADNQGAAPTAAVAAAPAKCPSARRAVKFYARRLRVWRAKVGAPKPAIHVQSRCPRYLASVLRRQAAIARKTYYLWRWHHFAWWDWLPEKYARVGACETGYGKRPGSWTWDSGTYISAFGIYRPAYAQFARAIGVPQWEERHTPRDQYKVASAIQGRYGWGAWGCGGA